MPVAIVHYHLRRGGVSRVIEAQSEALRTRGIDHLILAGTPYDGPLDLPVKVIPDLDYLDGDWPGGGKRLAATLREAAADALGTDPAIWHFHNPALGKSVLWPEMLRVFAGTPERMVWQHHDFAEDGRPGNYEMLAADPEIYAIAPQIRHAFINSRDRQFLITAGVPADETAFLPNAIVPPTMPPADAHSQAPEFPVVLYPVRGIRRKNLGELCLLAALAPAGTRFALTLKPENPDWRPVYDRWETFAGHHRLPVDLGVVGRLPPVPGTAPTYDNWLASSSHLATTSVAEGFGLSFLEPIAIGKPLLGRDLPDITVDFKKSDLRLGDLYEALLVPSEWIDLEALRHQLDHHLRHTYHSYGRELRPEMISTAFDALQHDGYLDFGNLPEPLQEIAVVRALAEPDAILAAIGNDRIPAARWLQESLECSQPASPPETLAPYRLDSYGDTLVTLYDHLRDVQTAPPRWLDAGRVLDQFLLPERFHFLRT